MKFDRCPDHDLTLSFCRPILFIQTLCFLCYLLLRFSSFLGFAEAKRGDVACDISGDGKNPLFPLLPFVQILFRPSVKRRLSEDFWVGVRKG